MTVAADMTKSKIHIRDLIAKLRFLMTDPDANEIGNFHTQESFARRLELGSRSTLRTYMEEDRNQKELLPVKLNLAVGKVFYLDTDSDKWRREDINAFRKS